MSTERVRSHASAGPSAACGATASVPALGGARSPAEEGEKKKRPLRPAPDDTKPVLRDPISRSDTVEAEQAVLRLPPFP